MTNPPKDTRVAAYYRCSTDGQEHSVEGQRTVIRKEVEKKNWVLVKEYQDEGESGATTDNRPGLQQLLGDAAHNRFNFALMYDVSRITRGGTIDFWWLVHQLKQHGIQLYCCARHLVANEQNSILFTVDAMQAREENIKRSRDAARGMHQSIFLRDQDPGRRPPFGYDHLRVDIATGNPIERIRYMRDGSKQIMTPDGSTVIRTIPRKETYPKGASLKTVLVPGDPEDVATLQRIFRETQVLGVQRLVNDLNKDGLLSPKGKPWRKGSLRSMLLNWAYAGYRVTNQVSRGRYYSYGKDGVVPKDEVKQGREHFTKRPESEWNVKEGTHEALVDTNMFHEVQASRKRRRNAKNINRKGKNQKREYLLSAGFGTCVRCGGGINGTTKMANGRQYPRYYCSTNRNVGPPACPGYSIPMDSLDEFILNEVRVIVTTPDCLAALATGLEAEFTRQRELHKPVTPDEAASLKAEQERIEESRRRLVEMVKGNKMSENLMKPEIERLALEYEALKRKLQQAKPALDKTRIKDLVKRGLEFYQERVLGPMGALASKKITVVEGAAEEGASKERTDAMPKDSENRPCVPELREMLRLLGVKFTYDPDRKEGTLDFDPFA
jgi:DNA invertase Pin-like site-specific DNA recombinase